MNDQALAQRFGRRMNHILVDRSLFAWVHRIFGTVAGCTCVFSAIVTHRITPHVWPSGSWQRGFSAVAAFFFIVAALPFVVSYSSNIDRVGASLLRTTLLGLSLALGSIAVDVCTFVAFRSDAYWPAILLLYFGQAAAYVLLGNLMLGDNLLGDSTDS
jgi:hypothetical protein